MPACSNSRPACKKTLTTTPYYPVYCRPDGYLRKTGNEVQADAAGSQSLCLDIPSRCCLVLDLYLADGMEQPCRPILHRAAIIPRCPSCRLEHSRPPAFTARWTRDSPQRLVHRRDPGGGLHGFKARTPATQRERYQLPSCRRGGQLATSASPGGWNRNHVEKWRADRADRKEGGGGPWCAFGPTCHLSLAGIGYSRSGPIGVHAKIKD